MSRLGDWLNRIAGPGHVGKAKVDPTQEVFHWPFVSLIKKPRGQWDMEVYSEPTFPRNPFGLTTVIKLGSLTLKEAWAVAIGRNDQAAQAWMRRKRKKRQQEHEQAAKDRHGGHTGASFRDCPACHDIIREQKEGGH